MKTELVVLAALMGLATYPWRAVPLLAPGVDRLPRPVLGYLRLVGPAVLMALAAVSVTVTIDGDRQTSLHVGIEWLAVGACATVVAARRNLLIGLVVAAGLVAAARAWGIVPLP